MSRYYPPVTVTGNPVNFSAPNGGKLDSVSVPIIPTQDLHGYANPWPAGGGKNMANYNTNYVPTTNVNNGAIKLFTVDLVEGKTYTYSCLQSVSVPTSTRNTLAIVESGGSYKYESTSGNYNPVNLRHVYTFTATVTGPCDFYILCHTPSVAATYSEWQVEESSSFTGYASYSNICPISGLTGLSVYRTGKNLFNKNATDQNAAHALNPSKATEYTAGSYTVTGFIKVKEGVKYITSGTGGSNDVCFYDANKSRLSGASNFNTAVTAPTGAEWLKFDYKTANADTVQLEEGSTATAYESFGNTYAVDWSTQAGTVYHGTVDPVAGQLIIDKYLYVYDGTEPFSKSGTALNGFYNQLTGTDLPHGWPAMANYNGISAITDEASSMMIPTRNANTYKQNYGYVYFDSGHNFDVPPEEFGTTVESFKAKLASLYADGTPLTVFCKLATPLTYQLTPQQIAALIDQNYIWSSNNETISVVYALLVPGSDKYTLIVNGVDIADFVERDSYRTTLYPVFSEAVQTLDGVGHTALLRKKGELSARFNPRTAADTAIICAALLNAPCEVQYHCLQRNADVTALMTIDSVSALYLSRCLYCRQKWNDIDSITLTEL